MSESPGDGAGEPAPTVQIDDLTFGWTRETLTLDMPRFEIAPGERVFLRGASGSGKSTLLGLICGVLTPRAGRVSVLGRDVGAMSGPQRDAMRAAELGVIFQMFNLLPFLSVTANVTLPCRFSAQRRARAAEAAGSAEQAAMTLLQRLGLGDPSLLNAPARALSVGQQQRVAAARALIGGPKLILADEPTSALDADARDAFLSLLLEECAAHRSSLLFVSHDAALADRFDRADDLGALNRVLQAGAEAAA